MPKNKYSDELKAEAFVLMHKLSPQEVSEATGIPVNYLGTIKRTHELKRLQEETAMRGESPVENEDGMMLGACVETERHPATESTAKSNMRKRLEAEKRLYQLIDKKTFENLCHIQCTKGEIRAILGVSEPTISEFCAVNYDGAKFEDVWAELTEAGKCSLRRAQWKNAIEKNNVTMQIWLGKQFLGQSDKNNFTGNVGLNVKVDWE